MTSEKELQLLIDHKVFFYGVPLWELAQELLSLRKAHEGWQLVPVEPTEDMMAAGTAVDGGLYCIWKDMLTAAPEVGE